MSRFFTALLLFVFSFNSLLAKVYPADGPLFDMSSPQCAIGRPLNEVVSEFFDQTTFVYRTTDYMRIYTSSAGYVSSFDLNHSRFLYPDIKDNDTLLYVYRNQHIDVPSSFTDTIVVFGATYTPGSTMAERKVKAFWFSSFVIETTDTSECNGGDLWIQSGYQDNSVVRPLASQNYINEEYFPDSCLVPNSTYDIPSGYVKTGKSLAYRYIHDTTSKWSSSYGSDCRKVLNHITRCWIGNINYCPVVEEIYDTLCRNDLPGKYNTSLTQSGTDTLFSGKTWYDADSTVILHLVVNEPSESSFDSVSYSHTVVDTVHKQLREVYVNAAGCDSVVICNLTIIPKERDSLVDVIPDKFFTPNGDGINDTWTIQNIGLYKNYIVRIYDRHGKELMRYKGNFKEWDGIYNGNPQPSTDYWYTISIDETDSELYGHFTLIR